MMYLDKYTVIKAPINSEKASMVGDSVNQYVFKVDRRATKKQIADAVTQLFDVQVVAVNTLINKPTKKRDMRRGGTRTVKGFKKAYVQLAPSQSINYNIG